MKRAIEPCMILAGDLIRYEFGNMPGSASEWRAEVDAISPYQARTGQHYLLDRPTPPVELPEVPTLGWIFTDLGDNDTRPIELAFLSRDGGYHKISGNHGQGGAFTADVVKSFTPAVAVPADALEALRIGYEQSDRRAGWEAAYRDLEPVVRDLLTAIDDAGSGAS